MDSDRDPGGPPARQGDGEGHASGAKGTGDHEARRADLGGSGPGYQHPGSHQQGNPHEADPGGLDGRGRPGDHLWPVPGPSLPGGTTGLQAVGHTGDREQRQFFGGTDPVRPMGPEEGGRGHPAELPGPGGECHRALYPGRERDELGHGFREEDGNDVCQAKSSSPVAPTTRRASTRRAAPSSPHGPMDQEVERESVEEIRDLETRLAILRDRCGLPPGGMES